MIDSLATSPTAVNSAGTTRRTLMARAGISALGLGAIGLMTPKASKAALVAKFGTKPHKFQITDDDIFNFGCNLEFLGAEFYLHAASNSTLRSEDISGTGTPGDVIGAGQVPFITPLVLQIAQEFAVDEQNHLRFFRSILGAKAVARPVVDFTAGFATIATAAGLSNASTFNPFGNERDFLLGSFLLEDTCVTALHGAAPYIRKPANVSGAAGLLGTEGYHAAALRTLIVQMGQSDPTIIADANLISNLRQKASVDADGAGATDQGVTNSDGSINIVPTDGDSVAFARTFPELLNILYVENANGKYGFFPNKLNGRIS